MKKLIVITGASSGFGAEIAKIFANENKYIILLIARRVDMMKKLNLKNAVIKKVDVTNLKQFQDAIDETVAKYGPVDLLVNNAGVMHLGYMGQQNTEEYNTMIDVNLKGVVNGIETVIKNMRSRKSGTIINIASTAGTKAYSEHAVYCATKFAVRGLTETLRQEVALDNVRVMSICPGAFTTELLGHTSDKKIINDYENWKKSMGEMANPNEVAKIIKYVYESPQELNFREIILHSTKQVG